ncbi:MAG: M48 family metallopeptidase [Verrucomicrobiaceae bacterium]|nr:M48 family metallopeptidase [Verrucomicrobiaceae bacterium]
MNVDNPWFLFALLGSLGLFHLELAADFLNLSRLPGADSAGTQDQKQEIERLVGYNTAVTKAGIVRSSISLGLLLAFWFCGGFGWLDAWTRSSGWDAAGTGVLLVAVLGAVQSVLALPFDVWDTFGIEARFGFNRSTPATFIADHVKGLVLSAVIGLPVVWLVVWFFATQPLAALYAWLSVVAAGVLMSWLAPRLIMPWFLKFEPLREGPLRDAILAMARRLEFPVSEVSVVDGSRRSSKANAFFAGFGRNKRIAIFDTLVSAHPADEIVAVLAHEIGHFKRRHVVWLMLAGFAQMAVIFVLLHVALRSPSLFVAFGVREMSPGMGLVLCMIIFRPLSTLLDVGQLALSRRFEFEADAFAADATGTASSLAGALKKLSHDQLSHPSPHPFYVRLHLSHPPVAERLRALESRGAPDETRA